MTQVSVVAPDGGEAIQLGPIQMRILEDGKTTAHRLGVGEITIPPGTAGPPQHRHAQRSSRSSARPGTCRSWSSPTPRSARWTRSSVRTRALGAGRQPEAVHHPVLVAGDERAAGDGRRRVALRQ